MLRSRERRRNAYDDLALNAIDPTQAKDVISQAGERDRRCGATRHDISHNRLGQAAAAIPSDVTTSRNDKHHPPQTDSRSGPD